MEYAVECRAICKFFGEGANKTAVLKSTNLKVKKGEFVMLVGPSGCGKTTLISIIAGILAPNSGKCIIEGNDLGQLGDEELIDFRAKNIGFVFQNYNLIPTLSVAENVAIPMIISNMDHLEATQNANLVLDVVGLSNMGNLRPSLLSGGQQQRVAIARSIIHKPMLIICDEPTSALDFHTGENIIGLLRKINKDLGTTFVVVTHDSRILRFADRIVYLDDGLIVKEESGEFYAQNAKH